MLAPPNTEKQLLERANKIAGATLGELAHQKNSSVPEDFNREKGWTGQLIELHLGALSGSKPQPDFPCLGIELKTIPIDKNGKPLETTFVSTVPLLNLSRLTWETSWVKAKLSRVLWVPVEGDKSIPIANRRIGMPICWTPNAKQLYLLRRDWQELTDMIALGKLEQIDARLGTVLQIRPKGANAKSLCQAIGPEGQPIMTLPRGFYLRTSFTHEILHQNYCIP